MQTTNKFIFTCLIAVILFTPVFSINVLAASKDTKHEAKVISQKHEETLNQDIKSHGEEATRLTPEGEQTEEHSLSHIWPHYGKMVIFAKIMFAFMLFSFIAPLAHFYIKGEKHH